MGRYRPPEVVRGGWAVLARNPAWAMDSWLYGSLLYEVFNHQSFHVDEASRPGSIPSVRHLPSLLDLLFLKRSV